MMAITLIAVFLFCVLQSAFVIPSAVDQLSTKIDGLTSAIEGLDQKLDTFSSNFAKYSETRQDECYKGMASLNKPIRTLVTIPGNRTALCDTVTDEGGWIVIQRRSDGKEDFYRDWDEYQSGFGDIAGRGDYWLGNEIIHQLTWTEGKGSRNTVLKVYPNQRRTFELRVDMVHQGQKYFAHYSSFYLGDETTKYTLHIGDYNGDAGDSLTYHNNMKFSTYDMENDNHETHICAVLVHSAWWYNACYESNLNGVWGATDATGINWPWEVRHGLSFSEMKIRLI